MKPYWNRRQYGHNQRGYARGRRNFMQRDRFHDSRSISPSPDFSNSLRPMFPQYLQYRPGTPFDFRNNFDDDLTLRLEEIESIKQSYGRDMVRSNLRSSVEREFRGESMSNAMPGFVNRMVDGCSSRKSMTRITDSRTSRNIMDKLENRSDEGRVPRNSMKNFSGEPRRSMERGIINARKSVEREIMIDEDVDYLSGRSSDLRYANDNLHETNFSKKFCRGGFVGVRRFQGDQEDNAWGHSNEVSPEENERSVTSGINNKIVGGKTDNTRKSVEREIIKENCPKGSNLLIKRHCESSNSLDKSNEGSDNNSMADTDDRSNEGRKKMLQRKIKNDQASSNSESSKIQMITFSSDESEKDFEWRKKDQKRHSKQSATSNGPEESLKLPLRNLLFQESLCLGDGEEEMIHPDDGSVVMMKYRLGNLPGYDGKTPYGQEGRRSFKAECCTFCCVVFYTKEKLQQHFLTRSHYNRYKAVLNDIEVMETIQKC